MDMEAIINKAADVNAQWRAQTRHQHVPVDGDLSVGFGFVEDQDRLPRVQVRLKRTMPRKLVARRMRKARRIADEMASRVEPSGIRVGGIVIITGRKAAKKRVQDGADQKGLKDRHLRTKKGAWTHHKR